MSEAVERILAALRECGCNPRRSGGGWAAKCPAHDDRAPSLSIGVGDDGRVLAHCHSGCTIGDIVAALGLTPADLFHDPARRNGHATPATPKPAKPASGARVFASAAEALADLERRHGPRSAEWVYRDAAGEPVGVVVRWDPPGGKKEVRPVSKIAEGWTTAKGMPAPRPLYRLPALLADTESTVYVTEGEKAADAAVRCGLLATTSPHGSKSAKQADWSALAGRAVAVLPDNDDAGEAYAADVARLAQKAGARSVRIVRLADRVPGAPSGFDLADLLDLSGGDTEGTRRAVVELADAAEPEAEHARTIAGCEGEPVLVNLAEVKPEPVRWLWTGRIPRGRLSLIVGRPGEGKSFATIDMAARVSTGTPWPDGSPCERGSVLLVSAEDDPGDTIRPRLDAHGADAGRVHLLAGVRRMTSGGKLAEACFTLADIGPLEQALDRLADVRLIVIDPIGSYLGAGADAHRDNEVRGVLAPLGALAQRTSAAVVLVAHTRKAKGDHADDLVLGSRGFTGIARSVLHLMRDPDDDDRRLLLPGKCNLSAPAPGLAFTIGGNPPRVVWSPDPVTTTTGEVLARTAGGAKGGARDEAAEWLKDVLSEGPRAAAEIRKLAEADGFAWRTVERANKRIGVIATREGYSSGGRWVRVLPGGTNT